MAEKGMFGNQYQQAVTDETALRRQSAQTGGMTGWAAITNAMSGIGSEIGYQGGQAMGGMTPAQSQQAKFESVMNSVPNFDPTNPASMREMSSALYSANFYDESMELLTQSNVFERNLAELKQIEAQTGSIISGDNLAEMKFNISKLYSEKQMEQIDQAIAESIAGVDTQTILTDLKSVFQDVDIKRIEQVINASKSSEIRADAQLSLNSELNAANINKITQQIAASQVGMDVDKARIKEVEQNILQSEAMISDLDSTQLSKNFKFAVANGDYDGSFTEYQKLISNLKTIQQEGSISLYEYAQTSAGGSYKGTLEDFVTSITGVDYKKSVASERAGADDDNTTLYNYSDSDETEVTNFLDDQIDSGVGDFLGRGTDYEKEVGKHLWQLAKNIGKPIDVIWNHYGGNAEYILSLPISRSLKPYTPDKKASDLITES
jgi:hypothetical protein